MGDASSRTFVAAALLALLAGLGAPAAAQAAGEVEGHVQDAEGNPLTGVAVKLLKAGEKAIQKQTSDAQGDFRFESLASGVYIAAVSLEGYDSVTCPGVRILASLTRRLEIKLMPDGGEEPSTCEAAELGEDGGRLARR